eukprot:TRINITY_DN10274_c0_g1_i1.p1 TRINITY_DN10274_c0_g1~~TRINITY_DN10274_c0_g1_i1.p1  ORF type:complete len:186 (+),score=30.13 TRINITY_DN10274_c0_g1_i1:3-560(+)
MPCVLKEDKMAQIANVVIVVFAATAFGLFFTSNFVDWSIQKVAGMTSNNFNLWKICSIMTCEDIPHLWECDMSNERENALCIKRASMQATAVTAGACAFLFAILALSSSVRNTLNGALIFGILAFLSGSATWALYFDVYSDDGILSNLATGWYLYTVAIGCSFIGILITLYAISTTKKRKRYFKF